MFIALFEHAKIITPLVQYTEGRAADFSREFRVALDCHCFFTVVENRISIVLIIIMTFVVN
jgi:hypothetical protein